MAKLDSDKLYEVYSNICVKYNSELLSKELFSLKIMEALYYLMSTMVKEQTCTLSMSLKIDNTLSCLIAPFKDGRISIVFDEPDVIKGMIEKYEDLAKRQSINPTELFE